MSLKALSDFNLVARHGGFSRAAEVAHRPKATLSRHVRDLELDLGVRLLERGGHRLQLTEEGRALYERTGQLLIEIVEAAQEVATARDRPRGRLRISAPLLFSQVVLGRLAAEFALCNPEVKIEVTLEDRNVDMVEEGYDLVIRVNPDPNETLIGRCFLRDRRVIVAPPSLALPGEGQAVPAVLLGTTGVPQSWRLRGADGVVMLRPEPVLRLSSLFMVRDAVRTGIGAALLPLSMISKDLANGQLTVWGEFEAPEIELWALYPSRRLLSRRVSAFLEHLRRAFPNATSGDLAHFIDVEPSRQRSGQQTS